MGSKGKVSRIDAAGVGDQNPLPGTEEVVELLLL
jgi:hypothetical protein